MRFKDHKETEINYLFSKALATVSTLPFHYLNDKWRWDIFAHNSTIREVDWNTYFWELSEELVGVTPPGTGSRPDDVLDGPTIYHVAQDYDMIRYFTRTILQFQFAESLCGAAGHLGSLHDCDFYGSLAAGDKLASMLKLGSSKPWPEALEVITGQTTMTADAIVRYFEPLKLWLEEQNYKNNNTVGWKTSKQKAAAANAQLNSVNNESPNVRTVPQYVQQQQQQQQLPTAHVHPVESRPHGQENPTVEIVKEMGEKNPTQVLEKSELKADNCSVQTGAQAGSENATILPSSTSGSENATVVKGDNLGSENATIEQGAAAGSEDVTVEKGASSPGSENATIEQEQGQKSGVENATVDQTANSSTGAENATIVAQEVNSGAENATVEKGASSSQPENATVEEFPTQQGDNQPTITTDNSTSSDDSSNSNSTLTETVEDKPKTDKENNGTKNETVESNNQNSSAPGSAPVQEVKSDSSAAKTENTIKEEDVKSNAILKDDSPKVV